MRLSPRSIFFVIVVIGMPFAVTIGWSAADPSATPSFTVPEGAGGAGGFGTAPTVTLSRSAEPVADSWTRTPDRAVSVHTPVQSSRPRSSVSAKPSATVTTVPEPTVSVPPEATPTTAAPEPTAPVTAVPTGEASEDTTGLLQGWR